MRRQRRGYRLLALIAGFSLLAAACGGDDDEAAPDEEAGAEEEAEQEVPEGGELVLGAEQEPDCTDWMGSCGGSSWGYWTMGVQTMPRSFDIVKNGDSWEYEASVLLEGEPELETEPQQVVTYHIAESAVWSDGTPITCDDWVYTWDQVKTQDAIYDRTGYQDIESVECPDPKTAVATFSQSYAGWKKLFGGQFGVYPAHILQGQDRNAAMANGYTWSGGPWIIEKWEKEVEIVLVPNENYWGEVPKLDRVTFRIISDTAAEFEAFQGGEVDGLYLQPQLDVIEELDTGIAGAEFEVNPDATPNLEALWMNNAVPPFDSVDVRKAFAYALDRAAIVERLFGGIGVTEPMNTFDARLLGEFGDTEAFADYEQDLDMVDELMEGDGWEKNGDGIWEKDGETATIQFRTTEGNLRRETTQDIVIDQAREAGFEVTADNQAAGDLFGQTLPEGDFQLALYAQVLTEIESNVCVIYCTENVPTAENGFSGNNWTRTDIDELTDLAHEVDQNPDPGERSDAAAQAVQLEAEEMVSLPLDPLPNIFLWRDTILGPLGENPILGPFQNLNQWGVPS